MTTSALAVRSYQEECDYFYNEIVNALSSPEGRYDFVYASTEKVVNGKVQNVGYIDLHNVEDEIHDDEELGKLLRWSLRKAPDSERIELLNKLTEKAIHKVAEHFCTEEVAAHY